jgi:phosphatidate cytidylyltransferase
MLTTRLVTAGAMLPLFIGALLFLPNAYWAVFLLPALLLASLEWAALAGCPRRAQWAYGGVAAACAVTLFVVSRRGGGAVFAGYTHLVTYWAAAVFWVFVVPLWLANGWRVQHRVAMACTGLLVLIPMWLALVALQTEPALLLMLLGVVWIADSAAYLAGRRLGRRRLAPRISPGKTWEGVLGACVGVAVYYAVLRLTVGAEEPMLRGTGGAILFAVLTVMSIEGDLFESWIKRQAGVKDSGRLLPGHGGMLDRIDGLTATMPLGALWLYYPGSTGAA